jgi:hypothetical protein
VLDLVVRSGESLDEFVADLKLFPQVIVNVKVREKRASLPSPPSPLLSMQRKKASRTPAASSSVTGARKRWRASSSKPRTNLPCSTMPPTSATNSVHNTRLAVRRRKLPTAIRDVRARIHSLQRPTFAVFAASRK